MGLDSSVFTLKRVKSKYDNLVIDKEAFAVFKRLYDQPNPGSGSQSHATQENTSRSLDAICIQYYDDPDRAAFSNNVHGIQPFHMKKHENAARNSQYIERWVNVSEAVRWNTNIPGNERIDFHLPAAGPPGS